MFRNASRGSKPYVGKKRDLTRGGKFVRDRPHVF